MIVVVTGSRSIADPDAVAKAIESAVTGPMGAYGTIAEVAEVWHGGARGVDAMADDWAGVENLTIRRFPVSSKEWTEYPKTAGKRRNYRMMKAAKEDPRCVVVVAVWDGVSGGTAHAIGWAVALGLPVYVEHVRVGGGS
jgi:Rieske Fe-S protein